MNASPSVTSLLLAVAVTLTGDAGVDSGAGDATPCGAAACANQREHECQGVRHRRRSLDLKKPESGRSYDSPVESASASTRVFLKTACAAAKPAALSARRTSGREVSATTRAPGLGIAEGHEPGVRHLAFARVGEVERHDVVAAPQHADRALPALGLEVRQHRDDPAPAQHALGEAQGAREIGAAAQRLARQQVADDPQRVVAAAPRRHVAFDAVGEEHRADAVVIGDRGEREHRRQLRRVVALQQVLRAELLRAGHVHHQQQREVALLDELLDVGRAHARRHVPVDRAHLVAGRVLAHLRELHPAPLEDGVVGAADPGLEDHPGADLDAADLAEGLAV